MERRSIDAAFVFATAGNRLQPFGPFATIRDNSAMTVRMGSASKAVTFGGYHVA